MSTPHDPFADEFATTGPGFHSLPDIAAIRELKTKRKWVSWKYLEKTKTNGETYLTKPPVCPHDNRPADVSKSWTWSEYDDAVSCSLHYRHAGVGYVLTGDDDISGFDLDKVRNPVTGRLDDSRRPSSISPRPTPRFHLPAAACACSGAASSTRPSPTTPHRSKSIRPSVTSRSRATGYPARRTVSGQRLKLWSCSAPASRPSRRPRPRQKPKQKTRQRARPGRRTNRDRTAAGCHCIRGEGRRQRVLEQRQKRRAGQSWLHGCRRYLRTPDSQPGTGAWRISSIDLGRDLEEDLSIHPTAFRTGASRKRRRPPSTSSSSMAALPMPSRPRSGCARRWGSLRRRLAGTKTATAMAGVLKIPHSPGRTRRRRINRTRRADQIRQPSEPPDRRYHRTNCPNPAQPSRPRRRNRRLHHRHRHLSAAGAGPGSRADHRGNGGRTAAGRSYPLRNASVHDRAGTVRRRQGSSARHDRRHPRPGRHGRLYRAFRVHLDAGGLQVPEPRAAVGLRHGRVWRLSQAHQQPQGFRLRGPDRGHAAHGVGLVLQANADPGMGRQDMGTIYAPALSIYGVSTPREFYASLAGADVTNGVLNRFLQIETKVRPAERMPTVDPTVVPPSILAGLKKIHVPRTDPASIPHQEDKGSGPQEAGHHARGREGPARTGPGNSGHG